MRISRRAMLGAAAGLPLPALAQGGWPDRPIRLIVAFQAGSVTDVPWSPPMQSTAMRTAAEPAGATAAAGSGAGALVAKGVGRW